MEGDEFPYRTSTTCTCRSSSTCSFNSIGLKEKDSSDDTCSSYNESTYSAKQLIEAQGQKLEELTLRCTQLLSENKRLQEKNNVTCRSPQYSPTNNTGKEQTTFGTCNIATLTSKTLENKNELLKNQIDVLLKELDEAHASIHHRDQSLEAYGSKISQLDDAVARLTAEKALAETSLHQQQIEMEELYQKKKELIAVEEELSFTEKEKEGIEEECNSLVSKLELTVSRGEELTTKLSEQTEEIQLVTHNLKTCKDSLEKSRRECNKKDKTIADLRCKLSRALDNEKGAKEEARSRQKSLNDALIASDKVKATCSILEENRQEEAGRSQELADAIVDMKTKHATELSVERQRFDKMMAEYNTLSNSLQRKEREKDLCEEELRQLSDNQKEEKMKTEQTIQSLLDRIVEAERLLDNAQKENECLKQTKEEAMRCNNNLKKELDEERSNVLCEQNRADAAERESKSLVLANNSIKVELERRILHLREDIDISAKQAQKRGSEMEAEISLLREETIRHQDLIKHKSDLHLRQESKLSEERVIGAHLLERNQELNQNINAILAEKLELSTVVSENEDKIMCLTHSLEQAEKKIAIIGKELSESIQDQEDRITAERDLQRKLRKVSAELHYVQQFSMLKDPSNSINDPLDSLKDPSDSGSSK